MKKRNTIVTFNPETDTHQSLTDWEWLDKATDADIDFSDIPPLGEDFFKNAVLRMPRIKKMVSIRLDEDLIDWYKRQGPGYQTRINAVLTAYMTAAQDAGSGPSDEGVKSVWAPANSARTASERAHSPRKAASERPHGARKVVKAPQKAKGRPTSKGHPAPKGSTTPKVDKVSPSRSQSRRAPKSRTAAR